MNMKLRHSWILLLLGGLFVMLVGAAPPSGAAACKADDFTVVLTGLTPVDLSEPSSITATVTAVSKACGNAVDTSYKSAVLRASGTSANGTFVSSGAAGIGDVNLRFRQGVATAEVTPSSDALGVKLTAIDGNSPSLFQKASDPFNVFDNVCDATEDCENTIGSTKGSGGTQVTVDLPEGLDGFLGLSLGDSTGATCTGAPTSAAPFGQAYVIAPPSDLGATETYTATVRFAKKLVPGTGVANFVHCLASPTTNAQGQVVLAYDRKLPCDNQVPVAKCIIDQRRNNAGELVVTFLLGPGPSDPGGIGFG